MKKYYFILLLLLMIVNPVAVLSAEKATLLDPIDKTVHDEVNLREVEISASRTQTRLKDMPASVSVVAAHALEKKRDFHPQ